MEIHVWVSIASERRTPEEISAFLGLESDSSWRIGDIRKSTIIKEKNHGWVLESGLPPAGADIEAHLEALLGRLRRVSEKIRTISTEAEVTVQCIVYTTERFGFAVENWAVRMIAEMGAALDYLPRRID